SILVTHPVSAIRFVSEPSPKFVFASTVAHLGLILRQSKYIDNTDIPSLAARMEHTFQGNLESPVVQELMTLIESASGL
ncbi:MAG: DUF3520 domain-containing protein, partial [Deltaproteobacteria bacterium]|nr:DUF3520 domain-containing protein [Deltaproteobacteria bacterium]